MQKQANATAAEVGSAAERDPVSANAVVVRLRADHVRVNLIWFDGGEVTFRHETLTEALDHLAYMGYCMTAPGGVQ